MLTFRDKNKAAAGPFWMAHSESLRSVRLIQFASTGFDTLHSHWDALQGSIEHEHPWIFRESTALESSTPQLQHWSQVNR